ncbi:MAG: very short patch repair endonuclease [Opitutaceae bacterium]
MSDIFSKRKRSQLMATIRSRGNKRTEGALVVLLRRHKIFGWRRHLPVFGRPDFIFPKLRLAIFVDGCFWHGCALHGTMPKHNETYWHAKLARNKVRDRLVTRTLRAQNWRVVRIWEHELCRHNEERLIAKLRRAVFPVT